MCIVTIVLSFFPSPFPSLPRSLCFFSATGPQNNASPQSARPPGLWVPVSTTPAEPCDTKVPETQIPWVKKLHLDEIYRSVPAMPPGTERKAMTQKWRTHLPHTFLTFQSWSLAPGPGRQESLTPSNHCFSSHSGRSYSTST